MLAKTLPEIRTRAIYRFFFLLPILIGGQYAHSQILEISGNDVNQYARIDAIMNADQDDVDSVIVQGASAIWDFTSAYEVALFIQMKGADVFDRANLPGGPSGFWGTVRSMNNTGIYSLMLVKDVVQDSIVIFSSSLREDMILSPSVPFTAQLVKVPYARILRLDGNLQARSWDPETGTGGVLALFAADKLDLNGYQIDVSGQGFAGGDTARLNADPVLCAKGDRTFYLDSEEDSAGRKGQSLVYETYPYTRGNNFLLGAGGGGQGRSSGGAGGSNAGSGGRGGNQVQDPCSGTYFGRGSAINSSYFGNSQNRFYLGTGGGSSVPEPPLTATPGGNGGGIVIIITDTLEAGPAGDTIWANGKSVTDTSFTGGGGGGAGGFVVLDLDHVKGSVHLDVSGGNGGNTYDNVLVHGPGGGGGGGVVWHSDTALLPGLTADISGGDKGLHLGGGEDVIVAGGNPGREDDNLIIQLRGFFFNFISGDEDLCQDSIPTLILGSEPKGDTAFVFQWQKMLSDSVWENIPGATKQNYVQDTALTVTTWFRRIVSPVSDPSETDTSLLVKKTVYPRIENNLVAPHDTVCYGLQPAPMMPVGGSLVGGNGSYSYRWWSRRDSESNWSDASALAEDGNADLPAYIPGNLLDTTYFRRQVISYVCTHISDSLSVIVLPSITGNLVAGDAHVCQHDVVDSLWGTQAVGGGDVAAGTGAYHYLWEQSPDQSAWTSTGVTDPLFAPGAMDESTTHYRRLVLSGKENTCKDTSNILTVEVDPEIRQNHIAPAPDTAICAGTPSHEIYPDSVLLGSVGNYLYTFEDSTVSQGSWAVARVASAENTYDPVTLSETTWFRRTVVSGQCTHVSNIIRFHVDPVITNNTISPVDTTLCAGTETGDVLGVGSPGGGNGSYRYRWDVSGDQLAWDTASLAASLPDLPSRELYDSTWFRRVVISGACTDSTAVLTVNVHDTLLGNTIWTNREACDKLPSLMMGTTELNGLSGGTGNPADFEYLWQVKYDPLAGSWETAPPGNQMNDQPGYETDTLYLADQVILYRRYVRSGACDHYSDPDTLRVRSRPEGSITTDPSPLESCFEGSDIGIRVDVSFENLDNMPFRLSYLDGQGGSGVEDNLGWYDGNFTVFRNSDDSTHYVITIDSIIDANGCWTLGGEGSSQAILYKRQSPETLQDTFRFCGDGQEISVSGGLGSMRYWGPSGHPDYAINPPDETTAIFTLNAWKNDTLFYPLYWYQKNGVCDADSVKLLLELYQEPEPAGADPLELEVFFRQTMPLWADSVEIGQGTWVNWDWTNEGLPPLSDVHNNRAIVDLGGTDNLQNMVNRKITWRVSNGTCPEDSVTLSIIRHDLATYTAFSPNGDGFNDYLILDGLEFADEFILKIYSRHGILVKTVTENDLLTDPLTLEQNAVWDGRMENGSDAGDGTYFYLIEVQHAGVKYNYKNYLELIRNSPK